jgi:hypothetical protein
MLFPVIRVSVRAEPGSTNESDSINNEEVVHLKTMLLMKPLHWCYWKFNTPSPLTRARDAPNPQEGTPRQVTSPGTVFSTPEYPIASSRIPSVTKTLKIVFFYTILHRQPDKGLLEVSGCPVSFSLFEVILNLLPCNARFQYIK